MVVVPVVGYEVPPVTVETTVVTPLTVVRVCCGKTMVVAPVEVNVVVVNDEEIDVVVVSVVVPVELVKLVVVVLVEVAEVTTPTER